MNWKQELAAIVLWLGLAIVFFRILLMRYGGNWKQRLIFAVMMTLLMGLPAWTVLLPRPIAFWYLGLLGPTLFALVLLLGRQP